MRRSAIGFTIYFLIGLVLMTIAVAAGELTMTTNYPYQAVCRATGSPLIFAGALSVAFLALAF
jgi:hypothetical protein